LRSREILYCRSQSWNFSKPRTATDFGSSNPFKDPKRQFNDIFGPSSRKFNFMSMFVEGKPEPQRQKRNKREDETEKFLGKSVRLFSDNRRPKF
jgi:hypothetical protein